MTPTPPARRRAGAAHRALPGDPRLPVTCWRLAISKSRTDIFPGGFSLLQAFCDRFCERCVLGLKRGGRDHLLHIQGSLELRYPTDAASIVFLRDRILKRWMGVGVFGRGNPDHAGCTVLIEPLQQGQDPIAMVGYVQKDMGEPHYQGYNIGCTDDELAQGRTRYWRYSTPHPPRACLTLADPSWSWSQIFRR